MNTFLVLFIVLSSFAAQAVLLRISGKNAAPLFSGVYTADLPSAVGAISVKIFDVNHILFDGGTFGVKAMYGLGNDLEFISGTEMKAYGWCFAIDGRISKNMADQSQILDQSSVIDWFYGYAHYRSGKWVGQCLK